MSKILFVLTSHDRKGILDQPTGFHLAEMTHVHHVLTEAGHEIDFASPKGGKAPVDALEMDDPINRAFMENAELRQRIENTQRLADVKPEQYDAVYFPGGHGTMWDLPENEHVERIVRDIYERGGVVGAVCHGPAAFVGLKLSSGRYLVESKDVSCFTNEEEVAVNLADVVPFLLASRLEANSANITKTSNFKKHVAVSERLVTGQNPASATGVGEAMRDLLKNAGRKAA